MTFLVNNKRARLFGCVAMLLSSAFMAAPAVAADQPGPKASIDELKASDAELTAALADLDAQVAKKQISLRSAQQALDAANTALANSDSAMAQAQARIDQLRGAAAQRAIDQYMYPQDDPIGRVLGSDGLADVGRRAALLQEVNGRDRDVIDQLGAARSDLERERKAATAARAIADQRRATEQAALDQLTKTRDEKARLDKSLQQRIETYAAEDEAGAASTKTTTSGRASRGGASSVDDRISAAGMRWPLQGPIRSPFGPRWGRMHTGIDIGGTEGAPIYAAKAGKVISANYDGSGYGNLTKIDNGGDLETWYAHQSRIAVSAGQTVEAGELIGYVGHTGHVVPANASGAHLHFETRIGGSPRNPQQYLP